MKDIILQDETSIGKDELSCWEFDWLTKIQAKLFEGHYIDLEEQTNEFIDKILRLRLKYTIEKAVITGISTGYHLFL